MSLLEQDITRKKWINKIQPKLDNSDNEEYKVKEISDSEIYAKELDDGHLPDLYYSVSWKSYPKEENG